MDTLHGLVYAPATPENYRVRDIESHFQIARIADDPSALRRFMVTTQAMQTQALINAHGTLSQIEFNLAGLREDRLQQQIQIINSLENLSDGISQVNEQLWEVVGVVSAGLSDISVHLQQQHQALCTITALLTNRLSGEAAEIARKGHILLDRGTRSLSSDFDQHDQLDALREALRRYEKVVNMPVGEDDYVVWHNIGWLRWKLDGDYQGAEVDFRKAILLAFDVKDEYYISALKHLAYMRYYQNDHHDACKFILRALQVEERPDILFDAARYAARIGQQDDAILYLEQAIRGHPRYYADMITERSEDFASIRAETEALETALLTELRSDMVSLAEILRALLAWARGRKDIESEDPACYPTAIERQARRILAVDWKSINYFTTIYLLQSLHHVAEELWWLAHARAEANDQLHALCRLFDDKQLGTPLEKSAHQLCSVVITRLDRSASERCLREMKQACCDLKALYAARIKCNASLGALRNIFKAQSTHTAIEQHAQKLNMLDVTNLDRVPVENVKVDVDRIYAELSLLYAAREELEEALASLMNAFDPANTATPAEQRAAALCQLEVIKLDQQKARKSTKEANALKEKLQKLASARRDLTRKIESLQKSLHTLLYSFSLGRYRFMPLINELEIGVTDIDEIAVVTTLERNALRLFILDVTSLSQAEAVAKIKEIEKCIADLKVLNSARQQAEQTLKAMRKIIDTSSTITPLEQRSQELSVTNILNLDVIKAKQLEQEALACQKGLEELYQLRHIVQTLIPCVNDSLTRMRQRAGDFQRKILFTPVFQTKIEIVKMKLNGKRLAEMEQPEIQNLVTLLQQIQNFSLFFLNTEWVRIEQRFFIMKYPVTVGQYRLSNMTEISSSEPLPSTEQDAQPVIGVSYDAALSFASRAGIELPEMRDWRLATSGKDHCFFPMADIWEICADARKTKRWGAFAGYEFSYRVVHGYQHGGGVEGTDCFGLFEVIGDLPSGYYKRDFPQFYKQLDLPGDMVICNRIGFRCIMPIA